MTKPTDPAPERQTIPQLCCHCGKLTRQPVRVGSVYTPSGAGSDLYACPDDAARYGQHTVRRAAS